MRFQLSYGTVQKLSEALKSGKPQPPPPYLYEKYNFSSNELENEVSITAKPILSTFNATLLKGNVEQNPCSSFAAFLAGYNMDILMQYFHIKV